jgi:hypothetical protein
LPVPVDSNDPDPITEFGVSISADMQHLTWRAAGEATAFIPEVADFFATVGAVPAEMDRLAQAGEQLLPEQLGYWLMAKADSQNAGWYFPVGMPLKEALTFVDADPINHTLSQWAQQFNVEGPVRVGRAVGGGKPYTELFIPIPSGDIEQQMFTALKIFEMLSTPLPPDEALELILSLKQQGLAVSLWVTAAGIVKTGLLSSIPETVLVIELGKLAGIEDYEPLAKFEGLLGVQGPDYVEARTQHQSFSVDMHYTLERDSLLTMSDKSDDLYSTAR